jgi:hypothetical protein
MLGNHTLVAVAASHLVAGLDLALHGDEDLDHLHHTRGQFVAALQLLDLVHEALFQLLLGFVVLRTQRLDFTHQAVIVERERPPLRPWIGVEHIGGDGIALLVALRPGNALLARQHVGQTAIDVAIKDRLLIVAVLAQTLDFLALDGNRTLILVDAVTVEHAHLNNGARTPGGTRRAGVAHVGGFLTEDGAQKLFFRRHRAFALRRDLADQNVAGFHFRPDIDHAGLIEVLQRLFRDVGNVAGDLFRAQLGVARHHLEFLKVDGGEHIVFHDALGHQDGVLEVVAVPRHERDEHVLAERQFTHLGGRTISDDLALLHLVTNRHQRTLVDAGVLVGTLELHQTVDVDARTTRIEIFGRTHNDARGIHLFDDAGAARADGSAGIRATIRSMPVPTSGASARTSGTA